MRAFFGFPAGHWVHLKASDPIESTFSPSGSAPGSPRTGSRHGAARLAMVFKRIEAASKRTRYVNGPHQVVLIRASAKFEKKIAHRAAR